MNIEYTVIFVINCVWNDFIKIILSQEHTQITIVKVNEFKLFLNRKIFITIAKVVMK